MEDLISKQIKDPNLAIETMKKYILVSKGYGTSNCFYALSGDKILVINETRKYYISKYEFIRDFNLSEFYIYKGLEEIEIDQEFRNLRQ